MIKFNVLFRYSIELVVKFGNEFGWKRQTKSGNTVQLFTQGSSLSAMVAQRGISEPLPFVSCDWPHQEPARKVSLEARSETRLCVPIRAGEEVPLQTHYQYKLHVELLSLVAEEYPNKLPLFAMVSSPFSRSLQVLGKIESWTYSSCCHALTFVQLGIWGQTLYALVFFLHYNFNNLNFKTMEEHLHRFTVLVQVSIFIFHYSFQGAIGKKSKKDEDQINCIHTFCLEVLGAFLKKKNL